MKKSLKRKILRLSKEFKAVPKKYRLKLAYRMGQYVISGRVAPLLELLEGINPAAVTVGFDEYDYFFINFRSPLDKYFDRIVELIHEEWSRSRKG